MRVGSQREGKTAAGVPPATTPDTSCVYPRVTSFATHHSRSHAVVAPPHSSARSGATATVSPSRSVLIALARSPRLAAPHPPHPQGRRKRRLRASEENRPRLLRGVRHSGVPRGPSRHVPWSV